MVVEYRSVASFSRIEWETVEVNELTILGAGYGRLSTVDAGIFFDICGFYEQGVKFYNGSKKVET